MPVYSIEMGQGIIARGSNLGVVTTALYSCTFIAGINPATGYAGAFHYPALSLRAFGEGVHESETNSPEYLKLVSSRYDIKSDMLDWLRTLRPTDVTLAFGKLSASHDVNKLENWCRAHCPGLICDFQEQTNAAMVVASGEMEVGRRIDVEAKYGGLFRAEHFNLHSSGAGNYASYFLFGQKR